MGRSSGRSESSSTSGGQSKLAEGVEPAAALEVGDEDDPRGIRPASSLASRTSSNAADGVDERLAEVGRLPRRLEFGQTCARDGPPAGGVERRDSAKLSSGPGRVVEGQDGQLVAGPEGRRSPGGLAPAPASRDRRGAGWRWRRPARRPGAARPSAASGHGLSEERPGKRQRQQHQRRGPEQQEQPVLQPAPPGQPRGRRREKHQRAERTGRAASGGSGGRGPVRRWPGRQDVEGREEAHRRPPRPGAIAPARPRPGARGP